MVNNNANSENESSHEKIESAARRATSTPLAPAQRTEVAVEPPPPPFWVSSEHKKKEKDDTNKNNKTSCMLKKPRTVPVRTEANSISISYAAQEPPQVVMTTTTTRAKPSTKKCSSWSGDKEIHHEQHQQQSDQSHNRTRKDRHNNHEGDCKMKKIKAAFAFPNRHRNVSNRNDTLVADQNEEEGMNHNTTTTDLCNNSTTASVFAHEEGQHQSQDQQQQQRSTGSLHHTPSDYIVRATLVDEQDEEMAQRRLSLARRIATAGQQGGAGNIVDIITTALLGDYHTNRSTNVTAGTTSSDHRPQDETPPPLLEAQPWRSTTIPLNEQQQEIKKRWRQFMVGLFLLVILIIVVVIVLVVGLDMFSSANSSSPTNRSQSDNNNDSSGNTSATPTSSTTTSPATPTAVPSQSPTTSPPTVFSLPSGFVDTNVLDIQQLLVDMNAAVFGGAEFNQHRQQEQQQQQEFILDESTYWMQALRFVERTSRHPTTNETMPTRRIIQRYALACIYFATNGVDSPYVPEKMYEEVNSNGLVVGVIGWKNSWNIHSDGNNKNSDDDSIYNECSWYGVKCNGGRVMELKFYNNGLTGHFPIETVLLRDTLQVLVLRDNFIFNNGVSNNDNGTEKLLWNYGDDLPSPSSAVDDMIQKGAWSNVTWLGQLTELKFLDLSRWYPGGFVYNQGIPPQLTNLHQLTELRISYNLFSGRQSKGSSEFLFTADKMPNLKILNMEGLSNLQRHGLPTTSELSALTNLEEFSIYDSNFEGDLSSFLGDTAATTTSNIFPPLKLLDLNQNSQIVGTIPTTIGFLTTLERFRIGYTGVTGPIPGRALAQLSNMLKLDLSDNAFSFSDNNTLADFGRALNNMAKLQYLYLSGSNLDGNLHDLFPSGVNGTIFSQLLQVSLRGNPSLRGTIPTSMVAPLPALDFLDISQCQLTGTIPTEFGLWSSNLRSLSLESNLLYGTIPVELGNLSRLSDLRLHDNDLSGAMPDSVCANHNAGNDFRVTADCKTPYVEVVCDCCFHCS